MNDRQSLLPQPNMPPDPDENQLSQGIITTLYHHEGSHHNTLTFYLDAHSSHVNILSRDHPIALLNLHHIVTTLTSQNRLGEARDVCNKLLREAETTLGRTHIFTLMMLKDLGRIYSRLGKHKKARQSYGRALTGFQETLGGTHLLALDMLYSIAMSHILQGNIRGVLGQLQTVLTGFEKKLGTAHPVVLGVVANIGTVHAVWGASHVAIEFNERALERVEGVLGAHDMTALVLMNLALVYSKAGMRDKGKEFFKRAERMEWRIKGRGRKIKFLLLPLACIAVVVIASLIRR